jgi:hypothetical protein
MRNEDKELIEQKMLVVNQPHFKDSAVETTFFSQIDGDIYPDRNYQKTPENFEVFVWRGDERSKDEIFDEDNEPNDRMIEAGKEDEKKMCP